jgi:hypothetical protein
MRGGPTMSRRTGSRLAGQDIARRRRILRSPCGGGEAGELTRALWLGGSPGIVPPNASEEAMKLQIAVSAADEAKLQALASALYADEASYLLDDAAPGHADIMPDLSGEHGTPEAEVVVAAIARVLATQIAEDGTLRIELEDPAMYGEGMECDLPGTVAVLKELTGARFVYVRGAEIARGERFPPYAEVRTAEGVFGARVDGHDGDGWEVVLPLGATEGQREAAEKVAEVVSRDGWLFPDEPMSAARP